MKRNLQLITMSIVLAVIFGTIYGVVQQMERRDANMPQIQLAQDVAAALNKGAAPSTQMGNSVDMDHSLAPFVIVYDKQGHVVAGSGMIGTNIPQAPLGMLQSARGTDYHAITWQPRSDIRIASVSVAANQYYVLSGRSLKEVEKNESSAFTLCAIGYVLSLAVVLLGSFLVGRQAGTVPPKTSKRTSTTI